MEPGETKFSIVLRHALPDDEEFLFNVFESACEPIVACLPLHAAGKREFVASQYRAMLLSRRQLYPSCSRDIIIVGERPAGFIAVDRRETRIRIVDVMLLPAFRNRGIGGTLLRTILAEADRHRMAVDLRVERSNPAKRLYDRLGFTAVGDDGVHITMERCPS